MKTVVVLFTRHQLSPQQLSELPQADLNLDLKELACRNITTMEEAGEIADALVQVVKDAGYRARVQLYGVVPAPLRAALLEREQTVWNADMDLSAKLSIHESFNVQRSVEGGRPTFQHNGWLHTQTFSF